MAWYDVFSTFYDAALERHYAPQHAVAVDALGLVDGSVVLDVPCGTGQAFPHLVRAVGRGSVIGVDLSPGMLRLAERRVAREGWKNVHLLHADAGALTLDALPARPDRLHVFLGTTVFPDPEAVLGRLWELLAPGGRCVLVDVHGDPVTLQGRLVQCMAQADVTRRGWEFLERRAGGFQRTVIADRGSDGGTMWMAVGTKEG